MATGSYAQFVHPSLLELVRRNPECFTRKAARERGEVGQQEAFAEKANMASAEDIRVWRTPGEIR